MHELPGRFIVTWVMSVEHPFARFGHLLFSLLLAAPTALCAPTAEPEIKGAQVVDLLDQYQARGAVVQREISQIGHQSSDPLVRALIRYAQSVIQRHQGQWAAAQKTIAPLAFIDQWTLANEERPARTVNVKGLSRGGLLLAEPLVHAPSGQCILATTTIDLNGEDNTVLFFGAAGQLTLLLDETTIYEGLESFTGPMPDRFGVRLRGEAGPHQLTARLCAPNGEQRAIFARLVTMTTPQRKNDTVSTLFTRLRRTASAVDATAEKQMRYIQFCRRTGAIPTRSPQLVDMAANLCERAPTLEHCEPAIILARQPTEQQRLLTKIKRHYPSNATLATLETTIGARLIPSISVSTLRNTARRFPQNPHLLCAVAKTLTTLDHAILAEPLLVQLEKRFSNTPDAARCVAQIAARNPLDKNTTRRIKKALQYWADDPDLQTALFRLVAPRQPARLAGRAQKLRSILFPDGPTWMMLVRTLWGTGHKSQSNQLLEQTIDTFTLFPSTLIEAARWLLANERIAEARYCMETGARITPENQWIQETMARFTGDDQFWAPYVTNAASLPGATEPAAQTEIALHHRVIRIRPSGRLGVFEQLVVRIGDQVGAKTYRNYSVQYAPDAQSVRILTTRVFHPDGTKQGRTNEGIMDLSEPWYRLYYDVSAKVVQLPPLKKGDLVEFQSIVEGITANTTPGDTFGLVEMVPKSFPTRQWGITLIVPRGHRINIGQLPTYIHKTTHETGDTDIIQFQGKQIPPIDIDLHRTPFWGTPHTIQLSSFASSAAMGVWYQQFIKDQQQTNRQIHVLARKLVAGETDPRKKVAAIYHYVTSHIRYVGLEFGVHGYKPYRAQQVLSRKFGDCKDTANLLTVMLAAVGIRARIALVRTRSLGIIPPAVPSLDYFNHAIAYLPDLNLWLDGTAPYHGITELPFEDQGVSALLIDGPRSAMVTTPEIMPKRNQHIKQTTIHLAEDGSADVNISATATGPTFAPWFRSTYDATDQRKKTAARQLSSQYGQIFVDKVRFHNLDNWELPVQYQISANVPHFAITSGDGRSVAIGRTFHLTVPPVVPRLSTVSIGPARVVEERVTLVLPPAHCISTIPPAISIEHPFGRFGQQVTQQGNTLKLTRILKIKKDRVPPAQMIALLAFAAQVEQLSSAQITYKRGPSCAK